MLRLSDKFTGKLSTEYTRVYNHLRKLCCPKVIARSVANKYCLLIKD